MDIKMNNIKVSVCIPIYGVEKYIDRCARSLFEQTLKEGIEFIFVNDCTKDNSIEILKNVIDKYPNRKDQIKIINHSENKGLPQARKTAIEYAKGDYVIHCDSDDWVDKNMYEILYEEANLKNYDLLFCDYFKSDGFNHTIFSKNSEATNHDILFRKVLAYSSALNPLWSVLVKRNLYEGIAYAIGNQSEDWTLVVQLLYKAERIGFIKKPLYYYYFNPISIQNKPGIEAIYSRFLQSRANHEIVFKWLEEIQESENYREEVIASKFNIKWRLFRGLSDSRLRQEWRSLYPEIGYKYLTNKFISFEKKIIYLLRNFFIKRKKLLKYI